MPGGRPAEISAEMTGSPASGFFMKYKFQMKQESSAPSVRNTATLYGVRAHCRGSWRVTNGVHSPISTPDTMQMTMLFFDAVRPPGRLPYALPSRITAISAQATPAASNPDSPSAAGRSSASTADHQSDPDGDRQGHRESGHVNCGHQQQVRQIEDRAGDQRHKILELSAE